MSRPWSLAITSWGRRIVADGPLTGIIVVDMTVAIQGPHAGAYLADMGADVVKVERPGGELNRYVHGPGFHPPAGTMGTQYVAMNRGKRGIVLDVHSDARARGACAGWSPGPTCSSPTTGARRSSAWGSATGTWPR